MNGYEFLDALKRFPADSFESRFFRASTRLCIGALLDRREMGLLFDAAYHAALCNIAINGLGGCGGEIRPSRESGRRRLEIEFMEARDLLLASPGWALMDESQRRMVQVVFLSVFVTDENLAW